MTIYKMRYVFIHSFSFYYFIWFYFILFYPFLNYLADLLTWGYGETAKKKLSEGNTLNIKMVGQKQPSLSHPQSLFYMDVLCLDTSNLYSQELQNIITFWVDVLLFYFKKIILHWIDIHSFIYFFEWRSE